MFRHNIKGLYEIYFSFQLPCRSGPQTTHSRINVEQNKESLINISKYRFSLVIAGLTRILHSVNEMVQYNFISIFIIFLCAISDFFVNWRVNWISLQHQHSQFQPEFEKNFYESQLIVLDTLQKVLCAVSYFVTCLSF